MNCEKVAPLFMCHIYYTPVKPVGRLLSYGYVDSKLGTETFALIGSACFIEIFVGCWSNAPCKEKLFI